MNRHAAFHRYRNRSCHMVGRKRKEAHIPVLKQEKAHISGPELLFLVKSVIVKAFLVILQKGPAAFQIQAPIDALNQVDQRPGQNRNRNHHTRYLTSGILQSQRGKSLPQHSGSFIRQNLLFLPHALRILIKIIPHLLFTGVQNLSKGDLLVSGFQGSRTGISTLRVIVTQLGSRSV